MTKKITRRRFLAGALKTAIAVPLTVCQTARGGGGG